MLLELVRERLGACFPRSEGNIGAHGTRLSPVQRTVDRRRDRLRALERSSSGYGKASRRLNFNSPAHPELSGLREEQAAAQRHGRARSPGGPDAAPGQYCWKEESSSRFGGRRNCIDVL